MQELEIVRAHDRELLAACAGWMAQSDPWRSLGIDAAALLQSMTHPLCESYLAHAGALGVGLLTLLMEGALPGYVKLLAVHPAHRGHGLGRSLLRHAEERIFCEVPNVFICVSALNPRAQQFYERCGYTVIGQLADYLVQGQAEILLRKSIGPILATKKG